jgi:hypothetical protein
MKKLLAFTVIAALVSSGLTTLAGPKEDVAAAIKKLSESANYTWKTTWENSQFRPDPSIGKIDKAGTAVQTASFGGNEIISVFKGEKAAMRGQDGWRSLEELESDTEGPGRWSAMMLRNFAPPTENASELLKSAPNLALKEGVISGDLTEEGAKQFLSFRRRRGGGEGGGPEISNASGSVKFWLADGALKKLSYTVKGTMSWNGNDRDMDRTIIIEISDVGSTKVEVPEGAKAKL